MGPLTALAATLLDLGWTLTGPWEWVPPNGTTYTCDEQELEAETLDWDTLLQAVATSAATRPWGTAAKDWCGKVPE